MDLFLPQKDQLSRLIQEKAEELLKKLQDLPVEQLGMPDYCLAYFKGSHFKRLFFSIETSAHLLYNSISLSKKPVQEIVLMDYGAGVGTLYTLAKMIGCNKVIYNDHLSDWKLSAQLIAEAIGVNVDEYITGDIDTTLEELSVKNLQCDIITSRNVIEHIYKLEDFYGAIARKQPKALVYSSTTANYNNPGSRIKHTLWHKKWEKEYLKERKSFIAGYAPQLETSIVASLATLTRGMAIQEIKKTVDLYYTSQKLPKPLAIGSNTCDPSNGVWAEHIIPFNEYRKLIDERNYKIHFLPGFWDTHYSKGWKNLMGKILNSVIKLNWNVGILVAPFIYVVAEKSPEVRSV